MDAVPSAPVVGDYGSAGSITAASWSRARHIGWLDRARWVLAFVTVGIGVGLAESGWLLYRQMRGDRLEIDVHPEFLWLTPLAQGAWGLLAGLLVAGFSWVLPRLTAITAPFLLGFLGTLAIACWFAELEPWARLILSLGAGFQAARWLRGSSPSSISTGSTGPQRPSRVGEVDDPCFEQGDGDRLGLVARAAPIMICLSLGVMVWSLARQEWRQRPQGASSFPPVATIPGPELHATTPAASANTATAPPLPTNRTAIRNVVWIVLDTVRADALSHLGYHRETTPKLDAWARRGVTFERAIAPCSWTFPSHASMFTGLTQESYDPDLKLVLPDRAYTIAERYSDAGYRTAGFVGNSSCCTQWFGLHQGFQRFDTHLLDPIVALRQPASGRRLLNVLAQSWDWVARKLDLPAPQRIPPLYRRFHSANDLNAKALAWLRRRDDRPFFLFLNYYDVHVPFLPKTTTNPRFGRPIEHWYEYAIVRMFYDLDPSRTAPSVLQFVRDAYDQCLADLDSAIDELLSELERTGRLEETLVIITSDHGESFGEHGQFGHGRLLHQEESWVPLILIAPGSPALPAGKRISTPVSLLDLPATVLDLTNHANDGTCRPAFPGQSLRRFWSQTTAQREESLPSDTTEAVYSELLPLTPDFLQHPTHHNRPLRLLVAGRYTFFRNREGREWLFDLENDPGETVNLIDSDDPVHQEAAQRLRAALAERIGRQTRF